MKSEDLVESAVQGSIVAIVFIIGGVCLVPIIGQFSFFLIGIGALSLLVFTLIIGWWIFFETIKIIWSIVTFKWLRR